MLSNFDLVPITAVVEPAIDLRRQRNGDFFSSAKDLCIVVIKIEKFNTNNMLLASILEGL